MAGSSTDYNGYQLIAVVIIFLIFTYISVGLRCFVRARITRAFATDDWLMLVAQIIFTFSCVCIIRGVYYGIGRHNSDLTVSNEIEGLKVTSPNLQFEDSFSLLSSTKLSRPFHMWPT
jgi:hypothetical protein